MKRLCLPLALLLLVGCGKAAALPPSPPTATTTITAQNQGSDPISRTHKKETPEAKPLRAFGFN